MTTESSSVSSGLNLWLELEDPERMPELLGDLLGESEAIRAALLNLHYVHYARFVPTPDYRALQVITSFDGEFDAYVLDFVLSIGDQFEKILTYVKDRPRSRVKDYPAEFLEFVRKNNLSYDGQGGGGIETYSAYPQQTVIDIIGASGIAPAAPDPQPVDVDRADVQANVLRGVNRQLAWHAGLRIGSAAGARAFLREILAGSNGAPQVTSDAQRNPAKGAPDYEMTLGFTFAGLRVLGIGKDDEAAFRRAHKAFVRGPDRAEAATAHGDIGDASPSHWQLGGPYPVDLVVTILADSVDVLSKWSEGLLVRALANQLTLVNKKWVAQAIVDPKHPHRRLVHFGYVDSLSQPRLAIQDDPVPPGEMQPRANVGEFLLGEHYPNVFGGNNSLGGLSPDLAQNGTFAALRIMEQDVRAFEALLAKAGAEHKVHPDWIAAKLMGRWRDGTPVSQSPDAPVDEPKALPRNAFDYLPSEDHPGTPDDSRGLRCPIGAHVRRMNPRSAIVAGRPHSRRLLRRGMPYVEEGSRGLIGVFLCADLDRQFEFILRQWAQGNRATTGIAGQRDPMLGAQAGPDDPHQQAPYRIPLEGGGAIEIDMPRLVKAVGSAYLFMPGLKGLAYLATDRGAKALPAFRAVPFSTQFRIWATAKAFGPDALQPDPATFDPRSKEFRDDPFPVYQWFRDHHPVVKLPAMESTWVFSYADVERASADLGSFRKRRSDDTSNAGLLNMDPPPHTTCRAQLEPLFVQVLQNVAPSYPALVQDCYAQRCKGQGQIDWIERFAKPVARTAFCELLGLPVAQVGGLLRDVEIALAMATPAADPETRAELGAKLKALALDVYMKYGKLAQPGRLYSLIQGMNHVHDPKNNKRIVVVDAETVEETVNTVTLALAGFLPLQWFIALATWRLLENDGALLQQLRANPSITSTQAVDELVRFDMSPPVSDRYVVKDGTKLGNLTLNKDDRVTLVFSSANHDPAQFGADADTINFKRNKGPGLALGPANEHHCLGHDMVYLVMKPVIEVLRSAEPIPKLSPNFTPSWGTFQEGAMFRAMVDLRIVC